MIKRMISGGQTGVDRAALDAALELRIPCGGWCPKGRRAEDGKIPLRYPLNDTPSEEYYQRTRWNVRDARGTLVLTRGALSGGTAQTVDIARELGRPCLVLDLTEEPHPEVVAQWAATHRITTLNVAGPRESRCPGIQLQAKRFLRAALLAFATQQALRGR
ncbi:MAG: putative molybdenum carrier protein [Candidatus Omnitrophica bacterium]|nr:putative molybdenum carrier protein [Candidatus Omnitrophota bacterium]